MPLQLFSKLPRTFLLLATGFTDFGEDFSFIASNYVLANW